MAKCAFELHKMSLDSTSFFANLESQSSGDSSNIDCVIVVIVFWLGNYKETWSNSDIVSELEKIKAFPM
jgi:hypothetical protein